MLFFRELGFGLDEIGAIVARTGYERSTALARQRELLEAKAERLLTMIGAVETVIEREERGMKLTKEEMLEVFVDFDPTEHEDEAVRRWGGTDAHSESARRTSSYSKQDWEQMGREADEINGAFVALMDAGAPAGSEDAMALAERHRAHISKWFYECTPEIYAGLGRMYVTDPRFTENMDRVAPGLAVYLAEAIAANAAPR